ncbi:hypothetical protein B7494_g7349, partial [Chlorociboria aeruginascens]
MHFATSLAFVAALLSVANTAPAPVPHGSVDYTARSYVDDKRALNAVEPENEKRGAALNAAAINAEALAEKRALNAVEPENEKRGAALNAAAVNAKALSEKRALNAVEPENEKRGAALNAAALNAASLSEKRALN